MNDKYKRTVAVLGSALALGGIGTGIALGASSPTSPTPAAAVTPAPAVTSPAPAVDVPTAGDTVDATNADVPTAGDKVDTASKDALTPGDKIDTRTDRETADKAGQEGIENPASEAASGPRESGEGTASDTGHADPPGQQVDFQEQGTR